MNLFSRLFKTFAPRAIGIAAAGLAGWVFNHSKGAVMIDGDALAKQVTGMFVAYAGAHRLASAVINPGDAATARVATAIHEAADDATTVVVAPKSK